MSLTNDQLLQRIEMIEQKLDEIQIALNNLASKSQMKALLNIRQSEIEDLQTRVSTLESKVEILEIS